MTRYLRALNPVRDLDFAKLASGFWGRPGIKVGLLAVTLRTSIFTILENQMGKQKMKWKEAYSECFEGCGLGRYVHWLGASGR